MMRRNLHVAVVAVSGTHNSSLPLGGCVCVNGFCVFKKKLFLIERRNEKKKIIM